MVMRQALEACHKGEWSRVASFGARLTPFLQDGECQPSLVSQLLERRSLRAPSSS